jgi:transposase
MKNNDEELPSTDTAQIERLIERVKQGRLEPGDAQSIEKLLRLLLMIISFLQGKNSTLLKLKEFLFGARKRKSDSDKSKDSGEEKASGSGEKEPTGSSKESAYSLVSAGDSSSNRPKRRGHGRLAASDYPGAKVVKVKHEELEAGDRCPDPDCRGRLHRLINPRVKIYLTGQPTISATRYEREVLRCSHCFRPQLAPLPEGVKADEKFDETADVSIVLSKLMAAIPYYRQARMQESYGVPLPESVQFERLERVADVVLAVYLYLYRMAAQGKLYYVDDTKVTILSCLKEDQHLDEEERRATQTSGIVVKDDEGHHVQLYFSGRKHAGENLDDLLARRKPELGPPLKMSDALAANGKKKAVTIDAKCWAHVDRKFKELEEIFPVECLTVLRTIRSVYRCDHETEGMSDEQRLEYHQRKSGPLLDQMWEWMDEQFRERRVEPNSALGKALQYVRNHWQGLTTFLTVPGTPLDNNIVERALKKFVLWRKNSLFFKTEHGAAVSGILLSLIESCRLNGGNPWEYLLSMMRHPDDVRRNPAAYLPWNYPPQESGAGREATAA